MRWLIGLVALVFCKVTFGQSLDGVVVIRSRGETKVNVSEKADGLWVHLAQPGVETNGHILSIFRREGSSWASSLETASGGLGASVSSIVAGRLRVDKRWRAIQPLLIETLPIVSDFAIGTAVTDVIPDSGAVKKRFNVSRRTTTLFEVVANRIGSKLDPVIRIVDKSGREIVSSDDDPYAGRDSRLRFVAEKPGDYAIEVRDVANGSGSDFFFVLRAMSDAEFEKHGWVVDSGERLGRFRFEEPNEGAADPMPKDATTAKRITRASPIPLRFVGNFGLGGIGGLYLIEAREQQKCVITAYTREFGSPLDARLKLLDRKGSVIAESVGAGADPASITNRLERGFYLIEVKEISKRGGTNFNFWLEARAAHPGVELTTEVERAEFSKEGEVKIKIACKRYDYDGPVKLEVEGLPEGVSVVDGRIAEKKNEVELKLKREKEVPAFQVRIKGKIEQEKTEGTERGFPVSTMPALKKLFPLQLFPCAAMDGWIAVNPPKD